MKNPDTPIYNDLRDQHGTIWDKVFEPSTEPKHALVRNSASIAGIPVTIERLTPDDFTYDVLTGGDVH